MAGGILGPNGTLISRSVCALCGGNYLLRGERYAQLIEMQRDMEIRMIPTPAGLIRATLEFVPLDDCIIVCMPCWWRECDGELQQYAHAPAAAEIGGFRIG